jgi:hypothetical protein
MAVVQISKIQIRRGLQEDLPQLASAELGWSIDERRLFIGNGTLAEGAPTTGRTEILTAQSIFSELAAITVLQGNVANIEADVTTIHSDIASLQANGAVGSTTLYDDVTSGNIGMVASPTIMSYAITRNNERRVGTLSGANFGSTTVTDDDYTETADVGVTFEFTGNMFQYTTTSTGYDAELKFFLTIF